jgi:hypothetical protein
MKQLLLKVLSFNLLIILFLSSSDSSLKAACNWKGRNPSFSTGDSCHTGNRSASLRGTINFNSNLSGCFKYTWKVNGNIVGKGNTLNYTISKNGTYTICVSILDTCNKCDTSICATKTISCIKNTCAWYKRGVSFSSWDSCKGNNGKSSLNALVSVQSKCYKYLWTVNGASVSGSTIMQYPISKNGTYTVCVKLLDTCDNCDTSYCRTFNISCFGGTCNWKSRNASYGTADSCFTNSNKILAYVNFNFNGKSCLKYAWSVNNTIIKGANSNYIQHLVYKNGTYNLCLKVIDTCNKCDTTYCFTKNITCINNTNKCAWYKRQLSYTTWDSCNGKRYKSSINGSFNTQNSCYKIQWIVNNNVVSDNKNLSYQITKNGYYSLCLKIIDTCDKCDTLICRSFNINCFTNCNWKGRNPTVFGWDTCKGNGYRNSVNAYISFNYNNSKCFKYIWKVNGVNVKNANSNILHYPIYQNGTYNMCVAVIDTCNNCDTTFCISKTVNCFGSKCNWKGRNPSLSVWDTCKGNGNRNSLNAVIYFNTNGISCYKYQWKVNGNLVKGSGNKLNYAINKNGTYTICVVVNDTCNRCDTSFCITKTINCFTSCNWKGRIYTINFFDSCNGLKYRNSASGYVVLNQNGNNSCVKYRWKVDNNIVSNTYYFIAPIYSNGAHTYCLTLIDSCLKCDTTICFTRNFNCKNLGVESSVHSELTIYPNPVADIVYLNSTVAYEVVEIYASNGQLVWKGQINVGDTAIDMSTMSKGVYVIRLRNSTETVIRKLVKE